MRKQMTPQEHILAAMEHLTIARTGLLTVEPTVDSSYCAKSPALRLTESALLALSQVK